MFHPLKSKVGFAERNPIAEPATFPAPVGGLNLRDAEAGMKPIYARKMVNFWPEERSVGLRKGSENFADTVSRPVEMLYSWNGVSGTKLFAFTDTGIVEVTAGGNAPSTSATWSKGESIVTNFRTSGQSYMVCVNGQDALKHYNGTSWTTINSFTVSGGSPINTTELMFVTASQRALYFLAKDSLSFYYMPPDLLATELKVFPLGGLTTKGGKLVAIGTWSIDGGSGQDDLTVFLTSKGQAIIYAGADPSTAGTWGLKGVFDLGEPLGKNPMFKLGGDLLVLTTYGLTSLTKVIQDGFSGKNSIYTEIVSPRFQALARNAQDTHGWQVIVDAARSLMIVNIPGVDSRGSIQLAMNLVTKAWTEFNGWNTPCWAFWNGQLYAGFGTKVRKMWTNSDDVGARIYCEVAGAWSYFTPRSRMKFLELIRFLIRLSGKLQVEAGVDVNFKSSDTWVPYQRSQADLARFDDAEWNVARWAALPDMKLDWLSIPCPEFYCLAPRLRIYSGDSTFEWSAVDYSFTVGDIIG